MSREMQWTQGIPELTDIYGNPTEYGKELTQMALGAVPIAGVNNVIKLPQVAYKSAKQLKNALDSYAILAKGDTAIDARAAREISKKIPDSAANELTKLQKYLNTPDIKPSKPMEGFLKDTNIFNNKTNYEAANEHMKKKTMDKWNQLIDMIKNYGGK